MRAAASNPGALAGVLAAANPKLSRAFERALLGKVMPLAAPANAKRPFGYQDPYAWQAFGAWMKSHGLIRHNADSGLAITDEFLPGLGETTVGAD